jgi:diguanylate cyclase (GGDEF)-like protein
MLDIDHFKTINDTWGHAIGDEVIRALVNASLEHLRGNDVLGRLGGEEFAVLLRGTSGENAARVAEALRQHLEGCRIETMSDNGPVTFTVSLGVAKLSPNDDSPLDALERADQALYKAKNSGRNRVVLDG